MGKDVAEGGWDGALEVMGQFALGYCLVANLVGLDESLLTELEI